MEHLISVTKSASGWKRARMRVRWFPLPEDYGNPYWSGLSTCLETLGVEFDRSPLHNGLGRRWLHENRGQLRAIHLHLVQPFYAYEGTRARLPWVLRFARNLALARVLGYETVLTMHDLRPTWPLRPLWVDYLGYWVAANLTTRVIVHYSSGRSLLARRYGRRRNVYAMPHPSYSGLYPNWISRSEARSRLGYASHETLFLFFGNIHPNKGVEGLVTTFRQISGDRLRLLITGKTSLGAEQLERIRERVAGDLRVRLMPEHVPDDEVQVYLNAADVVALPFKEVLTSGSAHLAMSFARPVVAPAMGSLPDSIAPGSGVLYDPADPQGLRRALLRCTKLDLEAMGKRAYEHVERFTFHDLARETLRVYSSHRS